MATQYGHFDDSRREFIITDPKLPWPWINYLGTENFFSLISATAGGYSFYKDAKFRRITRYRYNGVPADNGGRYFYINDEGCIWNPGWKPCKTELDSYECAHGMGYTRISGEKNGLRASALFFVPLGCNAEIQKLSLSNLSGKTKRFKLFSFTEWCLWNASTDMENFQRNLSTGEVEVEGSVIYHKTEYRERRNHYAFYAANRPVQSFDTDRESFLGMYNGFDAPQAVLNGKCSGSIAHGWSPIAAHCIDIELAAGASADIVFILGYAENPETEKFTPDRLLNKSVARDIVARYSDVAEVDRAFRELGAYWNALLGKFQTSTGIEELDRMVNIWNQYQCMVTFNMSRSASYFESGIGRGMGFRDSNQDLVGFVHQIPERARQRILDIAATQFPDGSCYHQYQPLTKRGNDGIGSGFNDDPLWLLFGCFAYLKETGDYSILDEMVTFDNAPGSEKSLLEHLRISFNFTGTHLGPHGLPLIGRADWNDCLNLNCFSSNPDDSFQTTENRSEGSKAESLMIAGLYMVVGKEFAELLKRLGEDASAVEASVENMENAVKEYGWDGEWFLRAYDYYGNKIGSSENEEGKIFIESQGWCTMARIGAEEGMCAKALDSVKKHLDCEHGIVLNNPAFSRYHIEMGEISSYPQGYKENAGIFCHNNPWVIIGEVLEGRVDDAWEHYCKISPAFIKDQKLHKVEPYVYCQMVSGKDAPVPGEGKNSWLTGTAAWNWYVASAFLLGIRPCWDGLEIKPALGSTPRRFTVTRRFREATYNLTINYSASGKSAFIPYSEGTHNIELDL